MADRRKRSPAMRYIKRNGLYILIVCVLLLVVGAVIAVVGQVKRLSPAKQEESSQTALLRRRSSRTREAAGERYIRRDGKRAGACG